MYPGISAMGLGVVVVLEGKGVDDGDASGNEVDLVVAGVDPVGAVVMN